MQNKLVGCPEACAAGRATCRLDDIQQALIGPIRQRRAMFAKDPAHVLEVIRNGTERARGRTDATRCEVVEGFGLFIL